jgi:hypothetical protein
MYWFVARAPDVTQVRFQYYWLTLRSAQSFRKPAANGGQVGRGMLFGSLSEPLPLIIFIPTITIAEAIGRI